jgi:hypothetical protein
MKSKIMITALLSALLINAASAEPSAVAGHVSTKYTSDYHRRGQELSAEAIQAQVGFNVGIGQVDVFGDFFTNQGTDNDIDTNELTVGLGTGLFDNNINAYLGVYNTDTTGSSNDLEGFASLQLNTVLEPTVSLYRDTDDDLYTFEGSISHTFDLQFANLDVSGVFGNTESSAATDSTYTGAKASLSRTFDTLNVYTDLAVSDNDTRDNETIWGVGLRLQF